MLARMIGKSVSRLCVALAAAFALVSCFETEQDFILNPDGSGKVVHESKFHPFDFNIAIGGHNPGEEEKMRQAVANIIEKSKGVDAWDDVHFERLDDGRILFRGTAWFPDLSKLKIENQMMLEFDWTRDPSGNGGLSLSFGNDGGDDEAEKNAPPEDEEGRRAWLAAERGKFQQARMMMGTMLTGMSQTATFRLPGNPAETRGFKDAGDGRLSVSFDGAVLNIDDDKSTVEAAVTGEGSSLLPKSDFQRRLGSINLSECKTHAMFDVNLDPPPAGSTRLRDLAGTIHYSVAADTVEIDLGITKIEKDQRGEELGAEITEIKPGWREDGPLQLSLRLNIGKDELVNAWIVRGDARQLLERQGYGSSANITTFTFELEKDFDPDARIVVEVYDEIRNLTTPFILRDIALPVIDVAEEP